MRIFGSRLALSTPPALPRIDTRDNACDDFINRWNSSVEWVDRPMIQESNGSAPAIYLQVAPSFFVSETVLPD
jgi:hypothetical protein